MSMIRIGALAIVTATALGCRTGTYTDGSDVKIIGGEAVPDDNISFKAVRQLLGVTGNCTGTFVTPTKMITAGHCLANSSNGGFLSVQPGNLPKPQSVEHQGIVGRPAAQVIFGTPNAYKDLVVLNFLAPTNVGTLPLCPSGPTVNEAVYIVGFGFDESGLDGLKRFAETKIVEINATNGTIKLEGTKAVTPGDSGGPLISVARSCVLGVASYVAPVSSTLFRSFFVDATSMRVRTFLKAAGLGTGGVTDTSTEGPSVDGLKCSATGGVIRRLEFISKTEVRDIDSFGPTMRPYTLVGNVLTIELFENARERYKVKNDGEKLVPATSNAEIVRFSCTRDDGDGPQDPSAGGEPRSFVGRRFENADGFAMTFVSATKLRMDDDAVLTPYSISGATLSLQITKSFTATYAIDGHGAGLQLVSDDPLDSPYRCTNCE